MLLVKCRIGVMLNLIQHLLYFVEIAGQARNDVRIVSLFRYKYKDKKYIVMNCEY